MQRRQKHLESWKQNSKDQNHTEQVEIAIIDSTLNYHKFLTTQGETDRINYKIKQTLVRKLITGKRTKTAKRTSKNEHIYRRKEGYKELETT